MQNRNHRTGMWQTLSLLTILTGPLWGQSDSMTTALDIKVRAFLEGHRNQWRDLNIPWRDGEYLYDLIVSKGYTRGLEIGTSTGHSAVWIAWAFSKTGGKLITIEIDKERHDEAVQNFAAAGLTDYIDARLADAHELVRHVDGPFDFVFSDADKEWYTQYFKDVAPKLTTGGCFTAHNATMRVRGVRDFLDYLKSRNDFETSVEMTKTSGISVSFKKSR